MAAPQLARAARYTVGTTTGARPPSKLVLLDVMDTLVADPFWRGFERDLFGMASMHELFAAKDSVSFEAFERGEISEQEHFATYFTDRRAVDGAAIKDYLRANFAWLPGMRELCVELRQCGVELATCTNYPAPWTPLVEDAVQLSELVPWAFISGEAGVRKPAAPAYAAALTSVGRGAGDVVFV